MANKNMGTMMPRKHLKKSYMIFQQVEISYSLTFLFEMEIGITTIWI